MGIISPRDFVDVILVKKYEDGTISSNGAPSLPLEVLSELMLGCEEPEPPCVFVSQPPMWSTQGAPPSPAMSAASTTPVAASAPRFQGESPPGGSRPDASPSPAQFFCLSFQGAQQDPGSELLPDGPRGPPAALSGGLLLPLQHGQLLQQLDQDSQISQRSLRPPTSRAAAVGSFSQDLL